MYLQFQNAVGTLVGRGGEGGEREVNLTSREGGERGRERERG